MSNHIGQEPGEQMLAGAPPSGLGSPRGPAVNGNMHQRFERATSLRRALRRLILILGLALAVNGVAAAATTGGPSDFISGLVNAALPALANKELTQESRAKEFRELLDKNFDMLRISRFVLGRYWQQATDPEKQRFLQLFEAYVVSCYTQPLSDFGGGTIRVIGSRPEGETMTLVRSEAVGADGGPAAKLDWRVRQDDDGFKIVDVVLEGVSIVLAQREELNSVITRAGSVAALNRLLEQKLGGGLTLAQPLAKSE